MNANDFISGFDYVDIKEKSDNAEPFEFKKTVKEKRWCNNKIIFGKVKNFEEYRRSVKR